MKSKLIRLSMAGMSAAMFMTMAACGADDVSTSVDEIEETVAEEKNGEPDEDAEKEDLASDWEAEGNTYYNRKIGYKLTIPGDWKVETSDNIESYDHDLQFLASSSNDKETIRIFETPGGAASVGKNDDAYSKEYVERLKSSEDDCDEAEVDVVEIQGEEYYLSVKHYTDGTYLGWIYYGENDGLINNQICIKTTDRERLNQMFSEMLSK